jgi:hypothetical protein
MKSSGLYGGQTEISAEILVSHDGKYEDGCLLDCCACRLV